MRVLESETNNYRAARAAAYYLVSTEVAARTEVDMERARIALNEHLSYCDSAKLVDDFWPEGNTRLVEKGIDDFLGAGNGNGNNGDPASHRSHA
jgi:hypothetical protein